MCNCGETFKDLAPFALRLAVGLVFFVHGYQKLTVFKTEGVTQMLQGLGVPAPEIFAVILIAVELVGGAALVLGFFTHWAAKLTGIVALVALILVHLPNGFWLADNGYEFMLLILAATISLAVTGGGRWSLDHLFLKSGESSM